MTDERRPRVVNAVLRLLTDCPDFNVENGTTSITMNLWEEPDFASSIADNWDDCLKFLTTLAPLLEHASNRVKAWSEHTYNRAILQRNSHIALRRQTNIGNHSGAQEKGVYVRARGCVVTMKGCYSNPKRSFPGPDFANVCFETLKLTVVNDGRAKVPEQLKTSHDSQLAFVHQCGSFRGGKMFQVGSLLQAGPGREQAWGLVNGVSIIREKFSSGGGLIDGLAMLGYDDFKGDMYIIQLFMPNLHGLPLDHVQNVRHTSMSWEHSTDVKDPNSTSKSKKRKTSV